MSTWLAKLLTAALSSCRLWTRTDHFAPHRHAAFEGYYARTQLEDGGTLAVIICWVKNAQERPHLVHISHTPPEGRQSSLPAFKYELFPGSLNVSLGTQSSDGRQLFTIEIPDIGFMRVSSDVTEVSLSYAEADLQVSLRLTTREQWSTDNCLAGPMGFISNLAPFLPLNWDVYSTGSATEYSLSFAGHTSTGGGITHLEKNWGSSFPPGWIWAQSFSTGPDTRRLCLAGGDALPGVVAYLIGYRSSSCHWDFRPPFAMAFGTRAYSPFMRVQHDSRAGTFRLAVQTLCRRLVVRIDAPSGSFMGLACPLRNGHRPMYAYESFRARVWVEAWSRRWPWGEWRLVEAGECGLGENESPSSALEFGGAYCHLVQEVGKMR